MRGRSTDAERRRILRDWKRSGLSSHDFARVCGVSHASLYKWKRELGAADSRRSPAFVEVVTPVSARAETDLPRDGAESGVELVYGATLRIHLRCGFDPATLRRAIEALAH
ncbi:MAG: transposase [Phycisphaeraceae bacterium]|nr:transposase [Phycisphaeraceae bacterium]